MERCTDQQLIDLLRRWLRVRQAQLVPPLIQNGPKYYLFSDPADPWGSRTRIGFLELLHLVEAAELRMRKPPAHEAGCEKERRAYA